MPRGLIISHLQLESRIIILPVLFIIPLVSHSMPPSPPLPLPLSFSFSLSYSRFSRPLQNQTTNEIKLKSLVNEAWSSVVVSRQPCSTPFEGEKERGIGLLSFRIAYVLLVRLKCTFYAGWSREDGHEKKFSTGSSWNCIPGSLFA